MDFLTAEGGTRPDVIHVIKAACMSHPCPGCMEMTFFNSSLVRKRTGGRILGKPARYFQPRFHDEVQQSALTRRSVQLYETAKVCGNCV